MLSQNIFPAQEILQRGARSLANSQVLSLHGVTSIFLALRQKAAHAKVAQTRRRKSLRSKELKQSAATKYRQDLTTFVFCDRMAAGKDEG